jgi:hypothetical protein
MFGWRQIDQGKIDLFDDFQTKHPLQFPGEGVHESRPFAWSARQEYSPATRLMRQAAVPSSSMRAGPSFTAKTVGALTSLVVVVPTGT